MPFEAVGLVSIVAASVVGVAALAKYGEVPSYLQVALPLIAATGGLLVSFWFGRAQGRSEAATVRIAIGGAPGSGKTVFVNVLMNVLMEETDPSLRFTAETRTAAAAIAAARRLAVNQWPTPTNENGLYRYSGTLERRNNSPLREYLGLNSDVRLELGDNASELWQQLSHESDGREASVNDGSLGLTSSSFFEYLSSAHSLLYFVSAEDLLLGPERFRTVVEDAISAFKLVAATRGPGQRGRSTRVALVISKADLFDDDQLRVVSQLVSGQGEFSFEEAFEAGEHPAAASGFGDAVKTLERLVSVISRRADDYSGFVLSSVAAALEARIVDDEFLVVNNIRDGALIRHAKSGRTITIEGAHLADPVRWSLAGYWRDRRAGRISS